MVSGLQQPVIAGLNQLLTGSVSTTAGAGGLAGGLGTLGGLLAVPAAALGVAGLVKGIVNSNTQKKIDTFNNQYNKILQNVQTTLKSLPNEASFNFNNASDVAAYNKQINTLKTSLNSQKSSIEKALFDIGDKSAYTEVDGAVQKVLDGLTQQEQILNGKVSAAESFGKYGINPSQITTPDSFNLNVKNTLAGAKENIAKASDIAKSLGLSGTNSADWANQLQQKEVGRTQTTQKLNQQLQQLQGRLKSTTDPKQKQQLQGQISQINSQIKSNSINPVSQTALETINNAKYGQQIVDYWTQAEAAQNAALATRTQQAQQINKPVETIGVPANNPTTTTTANNKLQQLQEFSNQLKQKIYQDTPTQPADTGNNADIFKLIATMAGGAGNLNLGNPEIATDGGAGNLYKLFADYLDNPSIPKYSGGVENNQVVNNNTTNNTTKILNNLLANLNVSSNYNYNSSPYNWHNLPQMQSMNIMKPSLSSLFGKTIFERGNTNG